MTRRSARQTVAHLRSISKAKPTRDQTERFPFSVPIVRTLEKLSFDSPVTFLVGENGSGKSTLLEGIAAAAGLPAVGSADLDADATLGAQRELAGALRLVWSRKTPRGFF